MRLIHTSDWHLGHTLHEISRRAEHLAFFDWLLGRLQALQADALLVAGDIFDTANPSAEAQADLYRFLATARQRLPGLDIVLIGGNHDSASRLDAPEPLLQAARPPAFGWRRAAFFHLPGGKEQHRPRTGQAAATAQVAPMGAAHGAAVAQRIAKVLVHTPAQPAVAGEVHVDRGSLPVQAFQGVVRQHVVEQRRALHKGLVAR